MNNQQNKIAGFWIRFIAKTIDVILISLLMILISLPNLNLEQVIGFKEPWNFYLWSSLSALLWPVYFIVLPLISNGYTLGLWIFRLRINIQAKNRKIAMFKREAFFSLIIAFNFLIVITVINHTLANRFFMVDQSEVKYSSWETFRISFTGVFISIGILVQMIAGISIIVKHGHGINDNYSETIIIYRNKFIKIKVEEKKNNKKYRPRLVEQELVEWID